MRLTLGGVPLHPALVHFPVAFWCAAPLADIAAWAGAGDRWWSVGWWCGIAGLAIALPAAAAGLLDAIASRSQPEAESTVWLHAMLVLTAASCFALALLFGAPAPEGSQRIANLALHGAGAACLLLGAHAGGRLAYVYRLPRP